MSIDIDVLQRRQSGIPGRHGTSADILPAIPSYRNPFSLPVITRRAPTLS